MSEEPTIKVFKCPACNMPQPKPFDECPQCGVIVSKYEKARNGSTDDASVTHDDGTSIWVDDPHVSSNEQEADPSEDTSRLKGDQAANGDGINIDEFVKDVRDHMIDSELMSKYRLSAEELRNLIEKQIDNDTLEYYEVYRRPVLHEERSGPKKDRHLPRTMIAFTVRVIDAHHPELKGWIIDITTEGLGISGIDMDVGDIKTLVIPATARRTPSEIVFDAECRWKRTQEPYGETIAGLEIKHISDDNLRALQNFIRSINLES